MAAAGERGRIGVAGIGLAALDQRSDMGEAGMLARAARAPFGDEQGQMKGNEIGRASCRERV